MSEINEDDQLRKLEWDSKYFGFNIALLNSQKVKPAYSNLLKTFVDQNNIELIYYLCDCHQSDSVLFAEKNLFHFVDIRLTFFISLNENFPDIQFDGEIKKATVEHIEELKIIADGLYKYSRYFFDGKFDRDRVNQFYKDWVVKAVLGQYDHECWCLFEAEKVAAFCTVRYDGEGRAFIGLVGVSRELKGRKLGKQLIQYVLRKLSREGVNQVRVVTQGRNYPAINLYITSGFQLFSTELWYHKWIKK
jgi:dTDP-4-amino-4,6-dideoxy-D-galactose acyltransferase